MTFISQLKTFVRDISAGKHARLSTPELKAKLADARAAAGVAYEKWQDLGEDDNPWAAPSYETLEAKHDYKACVAKARGLEKELRKRGVDTAEPRQPFSDGFEERARTGRPRSQQPQRAAPSSPEATRQSPVLRALLEEANVDTRALRICRMSLDYLQSDQLRHDVRALVPTREAFKKAALVLHPDKILPHARVAGARQAQELHQKTNALWQVFASVNSEQAR